MTEHARLVITAGEAAGIGPDVVLGALQSPFDAVSYTHLPSPRDPKTSRMPSSA